MNLAKVTFELAEEFMNNPKYVSVDYAGIKKFTDSLDFDPPQIPREPPQSDVAKICLLELIGDSINYCYWYGKDNIRPLACSSTKMYKILEAAFESYNPTGGVNSIGVCINKAIMGYSVERFPLLEERIKHLNEMKVNAQRFIQVLITSENDIPKNDLNYYMSHMLQLFPGYASDLFLKRAFLFFIELYRKFGWFSDEIQYIPIPADYQIPKMLESYGIITYSKELSNMVSGQVQIPRGSLIECEIRAASIIACREIGHKLKWNAADVDAFFWTKRDRVQTPFHLTVTTDY